MVLATTGGKTFAYGSENRLTSMNDGAVTLQYDGFGNRVAKTVSGVTTKYLVEDDMNPTGHPQVFDEVTNGAVTRSYTCGLRRKVMKKWKTSALNFLRGLKRSCRWTDHPRS